MEDRDQEIDELKELVRQNTLVTQETYKLVHKMHRAQQWGRFFQLLWWIVIIAVSGATYYLYFQPYVGKIEQLYSQAQNGTEQLQEWNGQIASFFKNIGSKNPAQTPASSTPH